MNTSTASSVIHPKPVSRRRFLGTALATSAVAGIVHSADSHAQEAGSAPPAAFDRKLKLGLIGCGGRGTWLGGLFQQHGGYQIHATADYFQAQADQAGDKFGVAKARRFSGLSAYQRLLESGVEAVTVVNLPRFHAGHAQAAIAAGCHVYAAKPVAIDVPGALKVQAVGRLATQQKLVYLVDYQIPTDPVNLEVVKRIHAGALGKLMHVDSLGFSSVWPDPPERKAENLLRSGNWITAIPLSGDFIVEYSIHTINAVLWAVGKRPVKASGRTRRCRANAHGDGRDLYLVSYEFDDGLVWTHRCQALNNGQDVLIRCEVYGDAAYAHVNYWGKSFLRGGPSQFGGGPVDNLYDQGAKRNIATFYQNIVGGNFDNPTPQQAGDDALTGVLGREAASRNKELTMQEIIAENQGLEFDMTGLKD
ncbi:MAG: Gfo/Idh/MocA family oxidoreductase [Verrucomicrobia bacterium]|nr:Gfo/Idh/MocA family oxidoreductase [Verrucomicrobiota bacterium]